MGIERIFSSGESLEDFCKNFLGGDKSGEIFFSHVKLRKQPFFAEIFKIQPPFQRPWSLRHYNSDKSSLAKLQNIR